MNIFFLTFSSVIRARLLPVVAMCAFLTFAVILLLITGITWLTADLVNLETVWLDTLVNWVAGLLTGVAGWFMLPALMVLFGGMFQEQIIHRVEKAYYPGAVKQEAPGFWPDFRHDLKFTVWALFLNLLILPFYLFGAGFIISIVLNTYLLGREFFEGVAGYHIGKPAAATLGNKNRKVVYTGGLVFTIMTLLPLINLFVPVFSTVWMVHEYHRIVGKTVYEKTD